MTTSLILRVSFDQMWPGAIRESNNQKEKTFGPSITKLNGKQSRRLFHIQTSTVQTHSWMEWYCAETSRVIRLSLTVHTLSLVSVSKQERDYFKQTRRSRPDGVFFFSRFWGKTGTNGEWHCRRVCVCLGKHKHSATFQQTATGFYRYQSTGQRLPGSLMWEALLTL